MAAISGAMSLPVGPYQVRAEKAGFKTELREGIHLVVGQEAILNLQMQLGDLSQQATVVEDVPVVNTTTSSVSGMVGEREVKRISPAQWPQLRQPDESQSGRHQWRGLSKAPTPAPATATLSR